MLLAEVTAAFQEIEAERRRQRVVRLLATLLQGAGADVSTLIYLLQGRLGPPYAAPTLGLDERRTAQALTEAAGLSVTAVMRRTAEQGDLGSVAEQVLPRQKESITLADVYHQLSRIAATSGPGAIQAKTEILSDLLRRVSAAEARVLVRIVQGKLRLGIGDSTVLDALALACAGDGVVRARLERAYSVCADLGLVAASALDGGAAALGRLQPTPGRPVLSALAARLPAPQDVIARMGPVVVEPKYDGLRLQVHKDGEHVWLFTRRLDDVTAAFPELTRAARRQIHHRRVILDGEAVAYDPATGLALSFQGTAQRRRTHAVQEVAARAPVRYFAFDLLALDGQDMMPLPQRERSRRVADVVREEPGGVLAVTPHANIADAASLERYFTEMVEQGHEGVVAKRPDAPYQAGVRSFAWVKLKREYQTALADTFDVVVVGYFRGRGRRARLGIGSLLCAVYDPEHDRYRTLTRVGSGLSEAEWVDLRQALDAARLEEQPRQVDARIMADVWTAPARVIEVIASDISRSPLHTCGSVGHGPGYALRFPRIVRVREDRRPEDATTEAEIEDLYRLRSARAGRVSESATPAGG